MMKKNSKIYIAGHNGMVGSSIVRKLKAEGYTNLVYRSSQELNLINQTAVADFFEKEKPEYIFMAAARVGGIHANNTYRADFIYENLMIECNITHQAYLHRVKKMLYLGSSCIYPKMAEQPLKEEYLLQGYLEYTNEPYAIAKIAGIKLCENYRQQYGCNFISAMPTNMYGPNDNYDLNTSHVLPALLRKFVGAWKDKSPRVEIWGSGSPLREFMYVDDMAAGCLFLMDHYNDEQHINIGSGQEVSIKELALLIKEIVGYEGEIFFNSAMPDGTPRKLLDCTRINQLGWQATTSLREGIKKVVQQTAELF
jgi:GDP-L-fucose synthase